MTPRTAAKFRFLLCLPALALCGWADPIPPEGLRHYGGATADTPPQDVALVLWGESEASREARGLVTHVNGISTVRPSASLLGGRGMALVGAYAVAVLPGRYALSAVCVQPNGTQTGASTELDAVAGRRYLLRCVGRTPRTMKLVAREEPPGAAAAPRPVPR